MLIQAVVRQGTPLSKPLQSMLVMLFSIGTSRGDRKTLLANDTGNAIGMAESLPGSLATQGMPCQKSSKQICWCSTLMVALAATGPCWQQ